MYVRNTFIYGLVDPRTKLVRYIGQTRAGISRPMRHKYDKYNPYKRNWIRQLITQNLDFEIAVLEYLRQDCSQDSLDSTEVWWIAYGRSCGWPLTNICSGGWSGRKGQKHTPESRQKMSDALRGKPRPAVAGDNNVSKRPEVRQKISESHKSSTKVQVHLKELHDAKRKEPVCGTQHGYARARKAANKGEPNCGPCEACMKASAKDRYDNRRKNNKLTPRVLSECGTASAYRRACKRAKRGVEHCGPCEACVAAYRQAERDRHERRKNKFTLEEIASSPA